jgi:hypothetical protein
VTRRDDELVGRPRERLVLGDREIDPARALRIVALARERHAFIVRDTGVLFERGATLVVVLICLLVLLGPRQPLSTVGGHAARVHASVPG